MSVVHEIYTGSDSVDTLFSRAFTVCAKNWTGNYSQQNILKLEYNARIKIFVRQ